jgi:hypothetical protein
MKGKIKMLNKKQLKKLPTRRLLALYRKNFKEMKKAYASVTNYGTMPENDEVKHCVELDKYCDVMKNILNTREKKLDR